jgi:hypothetical protein
MRLTAVLLSLLLVCACGGGSSSGTTPDDGSQNLSPLERSIEMLQACALTELAGLAELVELFQDAAEPGAAPPAFRVTGFDLLDASVDWAVAIDGDGPEDAAGTIRFRDADGQPTFPFDIAELLAGSFDLPSILGAIEDGTVVIVDYRLLRGTDTSGTLTFEVQDGTPGLTSGSMFINGADCQISLTFDGLSSDTAPGTYPTGTADVLILSQGSTLDGTVTFNGTSTAVINATLDGTDSFTFTYDLGTGQLTPVS